MEELESTLKGYKEVIDATGEGKTTAETVSVTVANTNYRKRPAKARD